MNIPIDKKESQGHPGGSFDLCRLHRLDTPVGHPNHAFQSQESDSGTGATRPLSGSGFSFS